MLSKLVISILAASAAALPADPNFKQDSQDQNDVIGLETRLYVDTYAPTYLMKKDGYSMDGESTESVVATDAFKSTDAPVSVYDDMPYYTPEVEERVVKVEYLLKEPKPEGELRFPCEYAKYETRSEGPHVPEFKPRTIYAEVMEKEFVCPKYEKIIVVKVPAKCVCAPIEVNPKIMPAPQLKQKTEDSRVLSTS
ncbi:hypothetical protein SeMB42_g04356 [Synchytrium endobioticum]|uniref:Spaetzle domain-containing protein n=1 Tax=Synchytrium endobioticum TaxID=286115 RepID=A0A507CYR0_9FUNG|nr:hypothetical protein SeLEV6574_g05060 [Synchytrium endobioticum]TPX44349.1 hypothetical protein SeMB42_g04356 [Synchytrium endobioticum]